MNDGVTDSIKQKNHKNEVRWYVELNQVCSLLAIRLKELVNFLNSLLKHRVIFSILIQEYYRDIKKVLQSSFELSQNLSSHGM